ncbi:hypothetical protein GGF32_000344, partial [Allomyces javanicus]
ILFGQVKARLKMNLTDAITDKNVERRILLCLRQFRDYDMAPTFKHCGYKNSGRFNPLPVFQSGNLARMEVELEWEGEFVGAVGDGAVLVEPLSDSESGDTGSDIDEDEDAMEE